MDNEKNIKSGVPAAGSEEDMSTTRARNRTVMLTPEITGQVRARLQQEIDSPAPGGGASDFTTPASASVGQRSPMLPPISSGGVSPRPGLPDPNGLRSSLPPGGQTAVLSQAPQPSTVVQRTQAKLTPVVGFLVSFDVNANGEIYELRSGRMIVTSEDSAGPGGGSALVIRDETVSPMHAILRVSAAGEIQVLDQLSEHGTRIKRFGSQEEEELSGEKGTLDHGDEISFGQRKFHVCLVVRSGAE